MKIHSQLKDVVKLIHHQYLSVLKWRDWLKWRQYAGMLVDNSTTRRDNQPLDNREGNFKWWKWNRQMVINYLESSSEQQIIHQELGQ